MAIRCALCCTVFRAPAFAAGFLAMLAGPPCCGDGCAGPFGLPVPAAGGHLCRRVSGAALLGLGGRQPAGPDDGDGLCHMDGLRFAARETLAL